MVKYQGHIDTKCHILHKICSRASILSKLLEGDRLRPSRSFVFLSPANEVWGKVMFLHLSVSHSLHRWGEGGVCLGLQMASEAGGTLPIGMHSSFGLFSLSVIHLLNKW